MVTVIIVVVIVIVIIVIVIVVVVATTLLMVNAIQPPIGKTLSTTMHSIRTFLDLTEHVSPSEKRGSPAISAVSRVAVALHAAALSAGPSDAAHP